MLRRRLLRWWRRAPLPRPLLGRLPFRAACTMKLLSLLPASGRWALLRIWLNGLCTARRFQNRAGCPWCKEREDALEHFFGCSVLWSVARSRLRVEWCSDKPLDALLLGRPLPVGGGLTRHLLFLHGLVSHHNQMRCGAAGASGDALWATIRGIAMRHGAYRRAVASTWVRGSRHRDIGRSAGALPRPRIVAKAAPRRGTEGVGVQWRQGANLQTVTA